MSSEAEHDLLLAEFLLACGFGLFCVVFSVVVLPFVALLFLPHRCEAVPVAEAGYGQICCRRCRLKLAFYIAFGIVAKSFRLGRLGPIRRVGVLSVDGHTWNTLNLIYKYITCTCIYIYIYYICMYKYIYILFL